MKPLLVLLIGLALLGCEAVFAKPSLFVGISAGGALTDISGKWNENAPQKFKTGLLAGGQLEYLTDSAPLWPHAGLRVEALYAQKGFKDQVRQMDEEGHDLGWKTFGTMHVDELVISAFYVARFPLAGITPFAEIGPEAGFPLHAKETVEFNPYDGPSSYYPSYWSKKPNLGLNFGAGVALPLSGGELTAGARYNLGLTNMFRYKDTIFWNNMSAYTTGFQLLFGYSFRLSAL